jgi:hypothetical protein
VLWFIILELIKFFSMVLGQILAPNLNIFTCLHERVEAWTYVCVCPCVPSLCPPLTLYKDEQKNNAHIFVGSIIGNDYFFLRRINAPTTASIIIIDMTAKIM